MSAFMGTIFSRFLAYPPTALSLCRRGKLQVPFDIAQGRLSATLRSKKHFRVVPWRGKRTADPSASPDFLLILLALTDFMRFSPTENRTRGCVQCSVAGNPGSLGMTKGRAVTFIRSR